jgi:UDP-N-acetylglucosamine diphosphorylase/glucosamine-1-phosphate N-acetyltransferase
VTVVHLLEPGAASPAWFPFAGARPLCELRAGARRIRERWCTALGATAVGIVDDVLGTWHELDEPPLASASQVTGPTWVCRSDAAPVLEPLTPSADIRMLTIGGEPVAWRLAEGEPWRGPSAYAGAGSREIGGLLLRGSWDLVTALERLLPDDARLLAAVPSDVPVGALMIGDARLIRVATPALVEPGVVFDTRNGAIVLEAGVEVRHGTRLEGPLVVGPGTRLLGGDLRGSSIGPRCNVRGEVSTSVFVGYANKGHDGFVGHSVLGHWVNLGAGTTTSNLKNTYGPVRLDPPGGRVETGRQFLGTLFGDHAKTAIGTMLGTGTLVGAGANVFGGLPPKTIPPLAWGVSGDARMDRDGFLAVATRVMPRRQIEVTPERTASLAALYERLAAR